MIRDLTAIDLFSGCGGLSLGLRRAGFGIAAAIEVDPIAAKTYRKNHVKTKLFIEDICGVESRRLTPLIPGRRPHLLAACAPCQGFCSLTAKCKREDPRNLLVLQVARFAEALQPEAIFMENVPGLGSRGRDLLRELTGRLANAGYLSNVGILQMADFGVPQNRRRLVLLAGRGFMIPFPAQTHAREPRLNCDLKPWVTLRDAIYLRSAPRKLSETRYAGGPGAYNWHVVRDLQDQTRRRLQAAYPGKTWLSVEESLRPQCHRGDYNGFTNVYGRMSWDSVAVTITSGCTTPCKGRFGHPDRRRTTISVREAAKLQTFPDSYRFHTDHMDAVCDMIGNAVPPMFAKVIGAQIARTLREHYATLAGKRPF
jgi:DNA (cytosine-5)-methyltransferase 1